MKMKNYITYFMLLGTVLLSAACNDEWEDEIYRKDVGLKAVINEQGVTNVYLPYTPNGEYIYQLPVIVGGSKVNENNLDVHITVDKDTLKDLNEARWKKRTDLYYLELDPKHYELLSPTCHIPAGSSLGLYDIKFKFSGLNLVEKWVLPLTIVEDPSYSVNPRKNYRKALLRVMPYNKYSGSYSATNMQVFLDGNDKAMVANTRTLFVVDETTCFFYAGIISEELIEREKYKINLKFNSDGTITAEPDDPDNAMRFEVDGSPTYEQWVEIDPVYNYIEHHYTTIKLAYKYSDVTTYGEENPIAYRATGTMLMERRLNTLKPEQDQIQW